MSNHVTNKELASYSAGVLRPRDAARIGAHIGECPACRVRHERLLSAISPRYNSLEAGNELRERILRTWKAIQAGDAHKEMAGIRSFITRRPGLAAASALAAAAIVAVIVAVVVRGPEIPGEASMIMARTGQGVSIDGRPAQLGDPVHGGESIKLADGSHARIMYDDLVRIDLAGKGDMTVRKFRTGFASGINFGITLDDGILVSSVHGGEGPVSYDYLTPSARIAPLGTEFLLQAAGGMTLLILKEGRVRITHARTGQSIDLAAGGKCIVSDAFRSMKATEEDLGISNDLEGLRAGKYAHLLLPAVLGPGASAGVSARTAETVKDAAVRDGAAGTHKAAVKRSAREESREIMRQRAEESRIQMNEMRRNSRMNMNQQMRRGR